jgi:hypothetical protein
MSYYNSLYYTYRPTSTHSTYYHSFKDYQTQQRGHGQKTGTTSDHRRHPPPSFTSGYSQSSFDSPSSYLSTPKDLFGYESQSASTKKSSGVGADAGASRSENQQQSGESISGMLSNFSKALGKCILNVNSTLLNWSWSY